ncbi:MAG: SPOR domain-containing protein, partial [Rhodanobacteraceae bacterium]
PTPAPATANPTPAVTEPAKEPTTVAPLRGWSVQVASFSESNAAEQLRGRLQQLGYAAHVDGAQVDGRARWRVLAGPVVNRAAAERLRASITDSLHIAGMLVAHQ